MTPEQLIEFNDLKEKVRLLSECLDPNFVEAIKRQASAVDVSTKLVSSGTQTVAEGGASTYDVATPMDGFIKIDGVNIPYYN